MPGLVTAWLVLLGLISLVWATRHLAISRAKAEQRALCSASYPGPPEPAPPVSVLVAAKDEEENIEACVVSFLEQDYPDFELIVIDDRSTDGTPTILGRLQSRFGDRLKVLTIKHLREGWFGKNNAMREGVAAAAGQWLCFTDADCRQTSPATLAMAMSEAAANGADFLSVLPVLETGSFWERIIQPVCAAVMVYWFHPDRVNDPRHPAAYANGAFMLIKREVYQAVGGHERVRTEVNEDMHLARIAKGRGFSLQVILQKDLYVTRMYTSLGQIWRGWSRIFYGCLGSFRRIAVALVVLTTFSILPWASLAGSLIGLLCAPADAAGPWWLILPAAAGTVALQQSVMARFYRLSRSEPRWSALYIVGALFCCGTLINAMLKLGGATQVTWRGTTYRGKRLADGAAAPIAVPADSVAKEVGAHGP